MEAILAEFRGWLSALPTLPPTADPEDEPLDLHTLLAQFTALRHEVNLQTKAARAQQEQNSETLRQLTEALDELLQARDAAAETQESTFGERLRPLLKALIELHDAVSRAGRELTRVLDAILPPLTQIVAVKAEDDEPLSIEIDIPPPAPLSWWSRWFHSPAPAFDADKLKQRVAALIKQERDRQRERLGYAVEGVERVKQLLASLATGYTMSLQRVERTLRQQGLEPIETVGQPFDPERMEVVEAVTGSGRANNEVIDELRRGYLWNGRVFRFAQVRVAKA